MPGSKTRLLLDAVSHREIPEDSKLSFEEVYALHPEAVIAWFHTVGNGADQRQFFINANDELGYNDNAHSLMGMFWRNGKWVSDWLNSAKVHTGFGGDDQ